jgi:ATP-binding cassette subfamily B protein
VAPQENSFPASVEVGEEVRAAALCDLLPDGTFGEEWLLLTDTRLMVWRDGEARGTRLELPLEHVSKPKVESVIGGGIVEVTREGEPLEVARFTNTRSKRVRSFVKALERRLAGEEGGGSLEEEHRCRTCGLPLEAGTEVCPACVSKTRTLRRLVGYLRPCWKPALGLGALAVVNTALGLVPPYLVKPFIDQVLTGRGGSGLGMRLRTLDVLVLVLLSSWLLKSVLGASMGWLAAWLGNRITHNVRSELYRHLQFLSLRFYDKRQLGNVISRVNQDTDMLQRFLVWGAQDLATDALLVAGIGTLLFVLNWKLALIVFVPAPLIGVLSIKFWRKIRHYMHRFFNRWSRLNSLLSETLSGQKIVKAFAQEGREIGRFDVRSTDLAATGVQAERTWSILFSAMTFLTMLGTVLVWRWGGRTVIGGEMTTGSLMAFLTLVAMFYHPIQSMSMLLNWSSRSLTAAERVFEILDTRPEVVDAGGPSTGSGGAGGEIVGRVEFRDVTFGYDEHKKVLKGVTFTVEPGEMIGLVGHSGAGKSTTINLLCRFYDVEEGEIRIDGVPIRTMALEDLRRQLGIVPQDTFLFSGTIAENISYAKPEATEEEVIRAAKIANAHDFILRKPDGYETLIGERGGGLSAGERQRIAIARAVLHNPRILILDEATSQVDIETEKHIQEAIDRLVSGRTTFAIAHRLSTLKNADRLIVLKEGEIREIGSHAELLEKGGEFSRLVSMYQEISRVSAVER